MIRSHVTNPCCMLQKASWLLWIQACVLWEKVCSVMYRVEGKKVCISECDFVDDRGMCLWSRTHMTHSVSHSMKLRRNIAETVNDVCDTTCCESSNSRPPFVSLYLLVSPDFVPLFRFSSLYRIRLAFCVWSIYSCGPIHCEQRKKKQHTNGSEFNLGFYESVTEADLKAPNSPWRKQENTSF